MLLASSLHLRLAFGVAGVSGGLQKGSHDVVWSSYFFLALLCFSGVRKLGRMLLGRPSMFENQD